MHVQQNHCLLVFRQTVVTHNFFRKLTTAWRNTARAPSYDFQRLNNKSLTKGHGPCLRTSYQSTRSCSTHSSTRRRPSSSGQSATRGRCATGSPRRLPTRNSRRSTGAGSGRTTGSSASTARSGGGRGSSGPSLTATRPSCW